MTSSFKREEGKGEVEIEKHTAKLSEDKLAAAASMKIVLCVTLMIVAFCLISEAVQVQEGEFSFSLESVKVLQQLTAQPRTQNPRLAKTSYYTVCANPTLPQEFVPLCLQKGATMSFARLASVSVDVCEICAFAACTGC